VVRHGPPRFPIRVANGHIDRLRRQVARFDAWHAGILEQMAGRFRVRGVVQDEAAGSL